MGHGNQGQTRQSNDKALPWQWIFYILTALNVIAVVFGCLYTARNPEFADARLVIAGAIIIFTVVNGLLGKHLFTLLQKAADQTEEHRQTAEHALRELKLQSFALDQHSIVAITDTAGRIQYVNDKFCEISKFPREELIGQDHRILNSGHHPTSFFQTMYQTIAKGEVWHAEVKNRAKDGSLYWVDTTIVPYRNENGRVDRYIAIRTDITDRKKAELDTKEAQKAAEHALRELKLQSFALDQHSIVAITDTAGRIQYVNDKFCEISKFPREELIGQDHRILNSGHHPTEFFSEMYQTIAKGKVWHAEVKNKAKDGSLYWVDTTIVPYRNAEGRVDRYIAIRTDITDRKKAELEVKHALLAAEEAKEAAEQANQTKSDFLANMSHEIRTPMNGVIGFSNLLIDSDLPSIPKGYVRNILHSAEALLTVINDILDFSKVEAGKLEIEPASFDLQETVKEIVELLSPKANDKGLELLLRYDPDLPRNIVADPGRVRQVILNLANNAVKFTDNGHVFINIKPDRSNRFIRIEIEDTGIGIPEEILPKLFQKFTQGDNSITRKFGGTGLGLAISKLLVELMGGNIGASSQKDYGSTFWIKLPLPVEEQKVLENEPDISGRKVLIVDDYPLNLELNQELCARWGLITDTAPEAESALAKLREAAADGTPFDFAILDYRMPNMDGKTLSKTIKDDPDIYTTKVILASSCNAPLTEPELADAGVFAQFLKPITDPAKLRQTMAMAIGLSGPMEIVQDERTQELEQSLPQGKFRMLIVDDTPVNQSLMRTILTQRLGYRVDVAGNGEEGLQLVEQFDYDLIFMDCMMPVMDGFEASKEVRRRERKENRPPIPIIALTAKAIKGDREKCLAAGMSDYLAKPIDFRQLTVVLNRWLNHDTNLPLAQFEQAEKEPKSADGLNGEDLLFDRNRIESTLKNAPELVPQMLNIFCQTLEELHEKARKYADFDELHHIAHTMKGSASEFGAVQISSLANQLEYACIAKDESTVKRLSAQLEMSISQTKVEIDAVLAEYP